MRVGFLNNQVDNRGTGNAVFDYAWYNQEILGNDSILFTQTFDNADPLMLRKIEKAGFEGGVNNLTNMSTWGLDVLYHIKYGNDQWGFLEAFCKEEGIRYAVHAVFDVFNPHGDRFAAISPWLAKRAPTEIPFVGHMVDQYDDPKIDMRHKLGIPDKALVFGRHGGPDTFDVPWVWTAMFEAMRQRDDIWFLFLGTNKVERMLEYWPTRNIISLPATSDRKTKGAFINTCDAMLHARERGETFGIAVGEFDWSGAPIITYGLSPERAHIEILKNDAIQYFSAPGLTDILINFEKITEYHGVMGGYEDYTADKVIQKFDEVFLK